MYAQALYTPIKKYVNKKQSVCRTCLKYGSNNIFLKIHERCNSGEEVKFSQMLGIIVPELVLSLTKNPEICLECAEEVTRSYRFRKKCLETENMIDLYMKSVKNTSKKLDLLEISQFSQSRFMKYNAQNIISEWEDDLSEDITSAGGTSETPVTNHPNILSRPSSKSKTDISNVNRNRQASPNKNGNVENWIRTASSPIILGQLEPVKTPENSNEISLLCTETGLFTKQKGYCITMDGELMNDKGIEAANLNVPADSLTICEETGLFKNQIGEHFNANGKMIDPRDVEAEKRTAMVRGHHLCRIGEVFSVNEREGQSLPKTSCEINESNKQTILINDDSGATRNDLNVIRKNLLRIRDLSSMTNQSINSTKDGLVDDGSKVQMRGESLLQIRNISTMKGQSNIQEESEKQKTPTSPIYRKVRIDDGSKAQMGGESLFRIRDISTMTGQSIIGVESLKQKHSVIKSKHGKVRIVKTFMKADEKDKETRKNTIETVNPPTIYPPTVEKNDTVLKQLLEKPLLPSETISKAAPATRSTPDVDNNNQNADITRRNPSEKEVEVKKELPDMEQLQINYPPIIDDEDTSSASETMSQRNIQELIDSLDAADSYIDVPEFVQINKFTFKDLEALKEKGLTLLKDASSPASLPPPPDSNPISPSTADLNLENMLKSQPDNKKTNRQEMLERLIVNEIEKARPEEPNSTSNNSVEKTDLPLPWTRKGIQKIPLATSKTVRRQRKRKLKIVPVAEKLASCPRSKSKERLVCVLKTSNKEKEMKYPDREVCVLFTNYSDDGLYINDHDYLVTPYKRNRILMEENGENFCMCFICGSKHNIIDHVPHMNSHEPKCPLCNVNLGTGYMLNLHMKVHASTCKYCSELVAYSKVSEHEANHMELDDVKDFPLGLDEEPEIHHKSRKKSPKKKSIGDKKSPPNKNSLSANKSSLDKEPLSNEEPPSEEKSSSEEKQPSDKKLSLHEKIQMDNEPKVVLEKVETPPVRRSAKRRKSTDDIINESLTGKRVLRSASKKTESSELPST